MLAELSLADGKEKEVGKRSYSLSEEDGHFVLTEILPQWSKKSHGGRFHLEVTDDDSFVTWIVNREHNTRYTRRP